MCGKKAQVNNGANDEFQGINYCEEIYECQLLKSGIFNKNYTFVTILVIHVILRWMIQINESMDNNRKESYLWRLWKVFNT